VQRATGPTDSAFDGSHGATANIGGLFIGEAAGAHQNERFTLFRWQHAHGEPHFVERDGRFGVVGGDQRALGRFLIELGLAPGPSLLE
jgi:hypothetical protein